MNTKYIALIGVLSLVFLASCSTDSVDTTIQTGEEVIDTTVEVSENIVNNVEDVITQEDESATAENDIVDTALSTGVHTTLVAGVQAADLVETLKSEGPFTVFAPTDEAFSELPDGALDTLLLPENKDELTGVLTYHVVAGEYTSGDLSDGLELATLQGETIVFTMDDGTWMINGSEIQTADVATSNGMIHVIDGVLLPNTSSQNNEDIDDADDADEDDEENDED